MFPMHLLFIQFIINILVHLLTVSLGHVKSFSYEEPIP